MEYPYFKGLEADRYSFYRVPKALVKADLFQKMSGDAKLLYAVLLDRMSLSIKNGWQDKHGNAYIICTIEEVMDSIHCARQKAVKLLDELEHEFQLIERRRQGLCKPNLLYVKDLYAGLSQSNYWKYENHTSGSLKNELPGVPKSNGSNTEKINKTDNSETDLIYPAELQEEEQYRRYFKEALELEILEQGYPADKAVLYEILELLVETVTSRKRFLRICGEEKPKEVVKSRLMKLDSSHIGQIPKFDKLIATIRSREISASIILQSQSQLKTIYKDAADTITGNCDCTLFLGGKEKSTLKEISEVLGKETIDLYNTSETRSNNNSYGLNYQKTGKELMSQDEIAVMDGAKCILQLRGVRPFLSNKYDITKHPKYRQLSDYNKRNAFDIEKYRQHKLVVKPDDTFDLYDMGEVDAD